MINIRPAAESDCANVFRLSNMDYVRQNSFQTEKILWDNHVRWFKNCLQDSRVKFFIIEENDFIGQVRLNIRDGNAVISISILKEFQNKGIASRVLRQIIEENDYSYSAQVKTANSISQKLFESLGFVRTDDESSEEYCNYVLAK